MNTSKLKNIAWAFFALVLIASNVQAQGRGNGNVQKQNATCLEQITDLNEKQKTQILKLEENHQKEIDELRNNRRATVDASQKDEIRSEMLESVSAHQASVKNLLNADQQKQYELLHARSANFRNQNSGNQNGRGFQNYGRRGAGNQQYAQGNRGGSNRNRAGFKQRNRNNNGCRGNYRGNNRNGRGNYSNL